MPGCIFGVAPDSVHRQSLRNLAVTKELDDLTVLDAAVSQPQEESGTSRREPLEGAEKLVRPLTYSCSQGQGQ